MSHILDNPADISAYRLLLIRSGLRLEISGLRHSTNSIFKAAQQLTGEKTRIKCLEAINRMIDQDWNNPIQFNQENKMKTTRKKYTVKALNGNTTSANSLQDGIDICNHLRSGALVVDQFGTVHFIKP